MIRYEAIVSLLYSYVSFIVENQKKQISETIHEKKIENDKIVSYLKDSTFSDYEIICNDTTFKCHKIILSLASDVFKTSMTSKFKDADTRYIMHDTKTYIVEIMLKYIYSKELPYDTLTINDASTDASINEIGQLLDLAETFQLLLLKNRCIDLITRVYNDIYLSHETTKHIEYLIATYSTLTISEGNKGISKRVFVKLN